MSSRPKKVIVLGWDGAHPEMIRRYKDHLPNLYRLMGRGVFAVNCLPPFPTITPPNWTSIATGAWPGTHGLTCFWMHHEGDELDHLSTAFDSSKNRAEYIWEAMERAGKTPIVLNWPSSWPPRVKKGIQLGGDNLCLGKSAAMESCFTTDDRESDYLYHVKIEKAQGWKNLPDSKLPPLQVSFDIPLTLEKRDISGTATRYVLLSASGDRGYDTADLTAVKDASSPLARLPKGQISDWIYDTFDMPDGEKWEVAYKMKLAELSKDGTAFELFLARATKTSGWTYPDSIAAELLEKVGPPYAATMGGAARRGLTDLETHMLLEEKMHEWYGDAAAHLIANHTWDGLFMHVHAVDFANHAFMPGADKLGVNAADFEKCNHYLMRAYRASDVVLGKVVEAAGDDVLYVVLSDHGSTTRIHPDRPFGNPHKTLGGVLEDAGLFVSTGKERDKWPFGPEIDWSKTKAVFQRSAYVYVNLKGRDPHGIVEPGDEYERIRDQIIRILYDYTDPDTGLKPIALALKKEDARLLGLYGPGVGDVVYAIRPEFTDEHGSQLPTARLGDGSQYAILAMGGPGIKKGFTLERTCWLVDVVPTICSMMGWPVPRHTEGAVLYQALED